MSVSNLPRRTVEPRIGQHRLLALLFLFVARSGIGAQATATPGPLSGQPFVRATGDMMSYELIPSYNGSYKDATFITNRWGMRDKEYAKTPAAGTFRIALLGSSYTMGGGVPQESTVEALLEDRLNREAIDSRHRRYEILNFSVGGYGILENVAVAERKVFPLAPHAVLLVIHSVEYTRILSTLVTRVRANTRIEYPYVQRKLDEAGVQPGMLEPELRRRISSVARDLIRASYEQIAETCRKHGVPLVGIAFPAPDGIPNTARSLAQVVSLATSAGIPVVDLPDVYAGRPVTDVWLKTSGPQSQDKDIHLNALGHKLVADRLFEQLRQNDARALKLGFPAAR
jgi:hypothetical protein